jgi:acetyl esterase/lipase
MSICRLAGWTLALWSLTVAASLAEEGVPSPRRDIEYARIGEQVLALDLNLPKSPSHPPLVVWVHGGAWRAGSKKDMPLGRLVERGYAVASVNYRLSPVAPFPAQVHDIKAAIRFLRAKASEYGFDSKRIAVAGGSAGGHLAALVGVTNGNKALEGDVGDNDSETSDVQAIVSFYGMSNLTTILSQSTPHGLKVRVPALQLLLRGQPDEKPELACQASPVFHVGENAPPLLLLHGDEDPQAPINQSHELEGAYKRLGRPVTLIVLHGAGHGGGLFFDEERIRAVDEFLQSAWLE